MARENFIRTILLAVKMLLLWDVTFGQTDQVTRNWWTKTALTGVSFRGYKAEFQNKSTIGCANLCSQNPPCASFSTYPRTGQCFIYEYRVLFGVNMTREDGYRHYWRKSESCPTDRGYTYVPSANVCYRGELDNRVPYLDALAVCQEEGGHLYIANTQEKLDIITNFVHDNNLLNVGVKLGAHDLYEEGWWNWLDGSPVAVGMWHTDQPDNWDSRQHCIEQTRNHPDYLSDGVCTNNERYACEIPLL